VRYVSYFSFAASILVAAIANAKCASTPTSERFSEAKTIVLVEIVSVRDGPVPYPYGLEKGSVPGKLMTLRVVRSWKGSLHQEDMISGWTWAHPIEHAYPSTDVGTKIIVFWDKTREDAISCCNSSYPERLGKTSDELDAIIRRDRSKVDPTNRWSGPC
jgi:hypothetical protein